MNRNPYLPEDAQTTVYGAVGEGLTGIGFFLPPPFNLVFLFLGAASRAYAFYTAKDRASAKPHSSETPS